MDISNITEKKASISAINASAIFHEVFSYGDFTGTLGTKALETTFSSIVASLVPGGYLIYRDLLHTIDTDKKVFYKSDLWGHFYDFFMPDFIEVLKKTGLNTKTLIYLKAKEGIFLTAPSTVHREFQRHYLTFRDFCRTSLSSVTGIRILDHFFEDISVGKKIFLVEIETNRNNMKLIKKYDLEKCKRLNASSNRRRVLYGLESDLFDLLYDDALLFLFREKNRHFQKGILGWKKREGFERYIYADVTELLELAIKVADDYVLFPENGDCLKIIERNYYNRYLEKGISNPEKDGKQIIIFKKMKVAEAIEALDYLRSNNGRALFKNNDRFHQLYKALRAKL